jgi:hypothetical protein
VGTSDSAERRKARVGFCEFPCEEAHPEQGMRMELKPRRTRARLERNGRHKTKAMLFCLLKRGNMRPLCRKHYGYTLIDINHSRKV